MLSTHGSNRKFPFQSIIYDVLSENEKEWTDLSMYAAVSLHWYINSRIDVRVSCVSVRKRTPRKITHIFKTCAKWRNPLRTTCCFKHTARALKQHRSAASSDSTRGRWRRWPSREARPLLKSASKMPERIVEKKKRCGGVNGDKWVEGKCHYTHIIITLRWNYNHWWMVQRVGFYL